MIQSAWRSARECEYQKSIGFDAPRSLLWTFLSPCHVLMHPNTNTSIIHTSLLYLSLDLAVPLSWSWSLHCVLYVGVAWRERVRWTMQQKWNLYIWTLMAWQGKKYSMMKGVSTASIVSSHWLHSQKNVCKGQGVHWYYIQYYCTTTSNLCCFHIVHFCGIHRQEEDSQRDKKRKSEVDGRLELEQPNTCLRCQMMEEGARFLIWGPTGDKEKDDRVAKYMASTLARTPMHWTPSFWKRPLYYSGNRVTSYSSNIKSSSEYCMQVELNLVGDNRYTGIL